ncbi:major facilitator superfamily MFS_1 [Fibrella aestuarina BUZ 2]|uniref:Major facilitator superfamily MFS_1 n=1 Tax=Fibrella aestuarina BUZ 2 TaxID=1166018 RepID=I0KCQ3_9BACT|nr:MFS transporter [Fibrella aestuarina]CCH01906.1 major facilitator superfamily MFS_1 [Fibrella aestuarina BUZ 2]
MNTTASRPQNPFVRNVATFFGSAQARAVGLVFASDSVLFGSWVSHIPHVKASLHLDDAQLGMTLFAMPAGLLTMNPLTGWLIGRLGPVQACFWAAIFLCLFMCIPVNAPNVWVLVGGLYGVGLSAALINVGMNTLATDVEKAHGISIMSSCHGMWSVGGMVGSAVAGVAIAQHVPPGVHVALMALLVLGLTFLIRPALQSIPLTVPEKASSFVRPNIDLFLMILIGLALAMGEGVAFDWSAVYLRETLGASSQVAALGFGAFSLTMTLGRFTGDVIIPHIGGRRWLFIGGIVGAVGLLLAVLFPYPPVALIGFALLGAGCSLGAPILYGAALRVPGIAPAAGLATFATFSFIGFLAGPPIIGFVADAFGLPWGLVFVAATLLISAGLSRIVNLF